MKNKNAPRRLMSLLMALLMILGAVNIDMLTAFAGTPWYTGEYLKIKHRGNSPLISYNSSSSTLFQPSEVYWPHAITNVDQYAYCVNPIWRGIENVDKEYSFDIMAFDETTTVNVGDKNVNSMSTAGNPMGDALAGAVVHGCPSRTATQVLGNDAAYYGVSDEDHEWAAYVATKFAIWALVRDEYCDFNKWDTFPNSSYPQALREDTLQAMKDIYNFASVYSPTSGTTLTVSTGTERDNNNGFLEINCTLSGGTIPINSTYYIRGIGASPLPAGAIIVNDSGVEYPKTTISGLLQYAIPASDNSFTVKYPKPASDEYSITLEYELYAERGNPILAYASANTTDPRQSYILAGTGYDNVPFTVTLNGEGDIQDPTEKEGGGSGKLKIIKLDAKDNMTGLKGNSFDIYNSKGQLVDSGTTDTSGTWIPNVTESGTYTIVERSTNPDYQLTEPTTLVITLEDGKEATATFRNFKKQDVTMVKEDSETGKPVPGCQYEIVQIDGRGAWRATGTTDSSGQIIWSDVPDGTYLVREVSTTSGYILDQTPQYVTVRNGMAPSLKFLDSRFPGLTITKVDQQTGEVIKSPAGFRIEQIDGDYSIDVVTENGVINIKDMPVGSYKIIEKSSPAGYVVSKDCGTVSLGLNASVQHIVYNLKTPILTIEKIDGQSGAGIPGTRFELYRDTGLIGTVETGKDGKVTIGLENGELGYLQPGTYTAKEVFVPEPYVLSGESQNIELFAGDSKNLLFANLEMPEIIVEKYNEQDPSEMLPDAQFAIYEQADTSRPIAEGVTDANGIFRSGKLKPGTYVVRELNPPPGWTYSDKTSSDRVIVAKAGDGEIIVKVDNIRLPELIILKQDEITKEGLGQFTFRITKTQDKTESDYVTDATGKIHLVLEEAIYDIREISGSNEYLINTEKVETIALERGKVKTVIFENIRKPTLIITKLSGLDFNPVPNTTFNIKYENPNGGIEDLGNYRTNADGKIILPNQRVGWYICEEVMAAPGMNLPSNPITRVYLKAGENSYTKEELGGNDGSGNNGNNGGSSPSGVEAKSGYDYMNGSEIVNWPKNSIVVKKKNGAAQGADQLLAGATFELYKVTGNESGTGGTLVSTATTDNSGIIVFVGLDAGAGYIVKESSPPPNYTLSENNEQQAWLKADATSIIELSFTNYPFGSLLVQKVNAQNSSEFIPNIKFKVTDSKGAVLGNANGIYETDENGSFLVSNIPPGTSVIVTELDTGSKKWVHDTTPQTILIGKDGSTYSMTFKNQPYGTLVLKKWSTSGLPLSDAEFLVKYADGTLVGNNNGVFRSNAHGLIEIPGVYGSIVVTETKAPPNHIISQQAHTQTIFIDYGETKTLEFVNAIKASVTVTKYGVEGTDLNSKIPLSNCKFIIEKINGEKIGSFTTTEGFFTVPYLEPGDYICYEIQTSSEEYLLDSTPQSFTISADGKPVDLTFYNYKKSGLQVRKFGVVGNENIPLDDVKFKLIRKSGEEVGVFTTRNGFFMVDNLDLGWYSCFEIEGKEGYLLDSTPQDFQITKETKLVTLDFYNKQMSGLQVRKYGVVGNENVPLDDVKFKLTKKSGEEVGFFTTRNGFFTVDNLEPGWYSCFEIEGQDGFLVDSTPQDFQITNETKLITLDFYNKKMSGVLISKFGMVDNDRKPLGGITMRITEKSGNLVGDFVTDPVTGTIQLDNLEPGWYTCQEVSVGNTGFSLDPTPQDFQITSNELVKLEFINYKLGSIHLKKISSVDRSPIPDISFTLSKLNGERIGDTYKTSATGEIFIGGLQPGTYVLQEVKNDGYEDDTEPRYIEVKIGETKFVEWENTPVSSLLLIKSDSTDKSKHLPGVIFEIRKENGELIGNDFKTDSKGRIYVELPAGNYHIVELIGLDGYEKPSGEIIKVTVRPGKQETVRVENTPLAGIRIFKRDSISKIGIPNTEFRVFDFETLKEVGGPYYSDDQGVVDFTGILPEGRYKILESREAPGYMRGDEIYRTVEFRAGQITEIIWENTPLLGQVQVMKRSAAGIDNEINGLPGGTPLEGAVYEIYDYRTRTVVDQFTSGPNGLAISRPVPLGRYLLKEVASPKYYKINDQEIDFEIEFSSQIVKFELTNEPANTGVSIRKVGPAETMAGQQIRYDFKVIQNTSTIPLTDFYFRDIIPGNALQLDKIVTGTYSQSLKYKIMYKTNKNDYRVMADNLSTTTNNVVLASPAALGLFADEHVLEIMFVFGNVKAGFSMVDTPSIYATVKSGLPNGFEIANRCDIGGKNGQEWVIGNAVWVTKVYNNKSEKLPRTGY